MVEFLIFISWMLSGLMIKTISDKVMCIEYEEMHYLAAMVVGPFIIWPILTIDLDSYLHMKKYRKQCTEELDRIIEEEREHGRP